MARKSLNKLIEEKKILEEKRKKIIEDIKAAKKYEGEKIALLAAEAGLTELNITNEQWKEIFEEVKKRFKKEQ
ncbi:TraC family protein [Bartonella schoenbuchensis]|uniref:Putative TraC family protein n=1 Tax=Bartonella schoenbuchensis (strain DSM 13525 / NCTC 13165 / R1) TaxID=687861 RepID=E6Z0R6_BARSR|nr:TraC family protein [Bartonella schoenbuchensis]AQX31514.1 TraC-like protein [Bartonella schoenbuchensis R1]CBI82704.1 putative TraC family protein [Bartonella schoenbuchensis R1]